MYAALASSFDGWNFPSGKWKSYWNNKQNQILIKKNCRLKWQIIVRIEFDIERLKMEPERDLFGIKTARIANRRKIFHRKFLSELMVWNLFRAQKMRNQFSILEWYIECFIFSHSIETNSKSRTSILIYRHFSLYFLNHWF